MKGLPSKRNAAVALSLFMAAWLPASAAWSSCAILTEQLLLANQGREENPVKPQDVTAEGNMMGSGFTVSWSLPSNRPVSTYTGFRIHFTHEASGETKYYDRTRTDTFFSTFGCITDYNCVGTFSIKVLMKNNCDLLEVYSTPISYEYDP